MYMAPIQRTSGGQRRGGVKFLFNLSAFLGVLAGVAYVFLIGQGRPAYHVQTLLTPVGGLETAANRSQPGSTHALWVGGKNDIPRSAAGTHAIRSAPEVAVTPSQMDRIAPASGRIDPPAAKAKPKAAPRSVTQLPTRRPARVRVQKTAVKQRTVRGRARSVAQATTADLIGPYRIQVGSFRTPEAAQDRWINLRRRHRDLLGGYIMIIEKVNRGRRGVIYRLQAGPLKSRRAVTRVCSRLSKRRIGCSLVDG